LRYVLKPIISKTFPVLSSSASAMKIPTAEEKSISK
jgi:hypothetical protein